MQKKILVVGSFVEDLIVSTAKMPTEGETIVGEAFNQADGGKGANQAVQAARIGGDVKMIGKVGSDSFGQSLVASCKESGIDVEHCFVDQGKSGISTVILDRQPNGEFKNRIIMTPGANNRLTVDDVKFLENIIDQYAYLVLQFEIPMEVNEYLAKIAHDKGVCVIVNPAPSKKISDAFLKNITYLAPNEHEFFDQTGISVVKDGKINEEEIVKGSKVLLEKGVENVIITLGDKGCCLINKDKVQFVDSLKGIKSVDPTAAGDSFIGSFVTAMSMGIPVVDSLYVGNAIGSLTVQKMGAMPSLSYKKELHDYLEKQTDANYSKLAKYFVTEEKEQSSKALDVFKAAALEEVTKTLNTLNFDFYKDAYNLILEAKKNGNRVHVTGIGKPSHIAQYFASLMSSTGTPAYYLHGTEAVHGSCGQLVPGDVVIAISNSGNTSELLNTLTAVKINGCKIIGVSGNAESKLAKMADAHLLAHIDNEGGPLNRAPRASILSETLVLQGLTVLLQDNANISPTQYVKWHPGGALGQLRESEKK